MSALEQERRKLERETQLGMHLYVVLAVASLVATMIEGRFGYLAIVCLVGIHAIYLFDRHRRLARAAAADAAQR